MNQKSIQEIQSELQKEEEEAILFVKWIKERSDELGITEDYFLMEFI
jgi:hypothetical protein